MVLDPLCAAAVMVSDPLAVCENAAGAMQQRQTKQQSTTRGAIRRIFNSKNFMVFLLESDWNTRVALQNFFISG
jgi:hypothetical protein